MSDPPATFRALVFAMRCAQKQYFKVRSQTNLKAALKLEMRVDAWLQRHRDELGEQQEWLDPQDQIAAAYDKARDEAWDEDR
jgi:hypothetical protein